MKQTRLLIVFILLCNTAVVNSCGYISDGSNAASGEPQDDSSNSDTEDSGAWVEKDNNLTHDGDQDEQYCYWFEYEGVRYIGEWIVLDNSIPFEYDIQSEITINSFYEITPGYTLALSQLGRRYPITTAHVNHNVLYTVYSLKDGRLAYVIIEFSPNTGVTYWAEDFVEYPYSSPEQEQKMWFLLPQDLPENILGSSQ